jgi:hypothetical protein
MKSSQDKDPIGVKRLLVGRLREIADEWRERERIGSERPPLCTVSVMAQDCAEVASMLEILADGIEEGLKEIPK